MDHLYLSFRHLGVSKPWVIYAFFRARSLPHGVLPSVYENNNCGYESRRPFGRRPWPFWTFHTSCPLPNSIEMLREVLVINGKPSNAWQ